MGATLSGDVLLKVLKIARHHHGNPTDEAAIGRRLFFKSHCGVPMVQVKFYRDGGRIRGSDLHVCVASACRHSVIPWW